MTNINLEMILKNFYTLKGLQYDISKNIRQNIIALIPEAIDSSLREFITEDNCSNYDLNKDQYSKKLIDVLDEKRLFIIMIYAQSIIAKNKKLDLYINLEMILKNFYTLKGLEYDISKNTRQNIIALIAEDIDSSLREFITEKNCSNYGLNEDQYSAKLIDVLDEERLFIIMIYAQSIIAKNKKLDLFDKILKFRSYNQYVDNNIINTNFEENFKILKDFFSQNKITIISNEVIYSFLYLKTEKLRESIRILNQINEEDRESIINLFFNLDPDIIQTSLIKDYNNKDFGRLNLILDHLNQKKCENKSQNIELIKLFFGFEKEKLKNYCYISLCNLIKKLDYEDLKTFFNSDAVKVLIEYDQLSVIDDIIDELPKISNAIQRFISSIKNIMWSLKKEIKFLDHLKSISNNVRDKKNIEELKYLLLFKYYKAKTSDILILDPFISKIKILNDQNLLLKFMKIDSENIYKISKFYGNDLLKLKEELFDEFFSIIECLNDISEKLFNLQTKLVYRENRNYSSYLADVLVKKREIEDISIFINIIKCRKEYYKEKFNNQKQDDEINFIKQIIENKYFFMSLKLLDRQNLLEEFCSPKKNLINLINDVLFNEYFFKIITKLYHSKTLKLLFDCEDETIKFFMEQSFKDNNLDLFLKNLYNQNLLEKFFEILKNNPELLKKAIEKNDPNIINIINNYHSKNNIDLSSVKEVDKLNITKLNSL